LPPALAGGEKDNIKGFSQNIDYYKLLLIRNNLAKAINI
jgi:hypothetical protein